MSGLFINQFLRLHNDPEKLNPVTYIIHNQKHWNKFSLDLKKMGLMFDKMSL